MKVTSEEPYVPKKVAKPLSRPSKSSLSISSFMNQTEAVEKEEIEIAKTEKLPTNHFTETDLQAEWNLLLKQLQNKNVFVFNAVKGFKLKKKDENIIEVLYPSDSAKTEFDKISGEFFNHFKTKVHNYSIEIEYKRDFENLKVEVLTKKKIYEKFIEKNPLLKDLDDLMRFDLT